MTSYCILPVNESHFKSRWATSTVFAPFWVDFSNVCKLQWRGLDNVAGGNLSATLPMLQKGFGGCRCVSAWEKCKCSAETTPHMHLHPHIFPFFIVRLLFCLSLHPPATPSSPGLWDFLSLIRIFAGDTMSLRSISPCPPPHGLLRLLFFWMSRSTYLHWPSYLNKPTRQSSPS